MSEDPEEEPWNREHPLLNSLILNQIFDDETFHFNDFKEFRLVCKFWNEEATKRCLRVYSWSKWNYLKPEPKKIKNGKDLEKGTEILKSKSTSPLITHVDFGKEIPLCCHTDIFKFVNAAENKFTGVTFHFDYGNRCDLRFLRRFLEDCEVSELEIYWSRHQDDLGLFALEGERLFFPSVKSLTFHTRSNVTTYQGIVGDLLESCLNLEKLKLGEAYKNDILSWFYSDVLYEDSPALPSLQELPSYPGYEFSDSDLRAITNRQFPLTKIHLECHKFHIRTDSLEGLFLGVRNTLTDLYLRLKPGRQKNMKTLSTALRHLENLKKLEVIGMNITLGTIWTCMKKLRNLKIRRFCHDSFTFDKPPLDAGEKESWQRPLIKLTLGGSSKPKQSKELVELLLKLYPKVYLLRMSPEIAHYNRKYFPKTEAEELLASLQVDDETWTGRSDMEEECEDEEESTDSDTSSDYWESPFF